VKAFWRRDLQTLNRWREGRPLDEHLDLMMRSLLSIGATPRDIAKLLQKAGAA
jgi:hypothetical protein